MRKKKVANYNDYLRSEHWQDVKKRYRQSRYPWVCFCCGASDRPLDLHHRSYKRLGQERLMDLLPLCRECHDAVHVRVRSSNAAPSRLPTVLWGAARRHKRQLAKRRRK